MSLHLVSTEQFVLSREVI